jgi:hypothetical protein
MDSSKDADSSTFKDLSYLLIIARFLVKKNILLDILNLYD